MAIVDVHRARATADVWHIAMSGMAELQHVLQHRIAAAVEFLLQKRMRLHIVVAGGVVVGVVAVRHDIVVIVNGAQFVH